MSNSRFENFLAQMKTFGFKMDSRIEQKEVDGLLGMYATEDIPRGTPFVRFPVSMMIPHSETIDFSGSPYEETHSQIHAIARELASPNSPYIAYFEYCGTLKERESQSVCFFTHDEFSSLEKMNPLLAQSALTSKAYWENTVNTVCARDPSIPREHVMLAAFIHRERCWGKGFGFLPGIDLFNHSTKSEIFPQRGLVDGEECVFFVSQEDINSGDEILATYGKKDMYDFLLEYNFFDPHDYHLVSYSARITQTIRDNFIQQVVNNLKQYYDVRTRLNNGQTQFKINEQQAFFLNQGPNTKMVDLVSRLAIDNEKALKKGQAEEKTTARYMLYILQSLKNANNVKSMTKEPLPKKLHVFHDMLTAELEILGANIRAIEPRCA